MAGYFAEMEITVCLIFLTHTLNQKAAFSLKIHATIAL